MLVISFDVRAFVVFSLVDAVYEVLVSIVQTSVVQGVYAAQEGYRKDSLETEYAVASEAPLALGRVISLLGFGGLLLLYPSAQAEVLRMSLLVIGLVPYGVMLLVRYVSVFRQQVGMESGGGEWKPA